jgi:hypothetical protein
VPGRAGDSPAKVLRAGAGAGDSPAKVERVRAGRASSDVRAHQHLPPVPGVGETGDGDFALTTGDEDEDTSPSQPGHVQPGLSK